MKQAKALFEAVKRSAPYAVWQRYSDARGNLLAGGVTYFSFLSIFPALALAFTVFGVFLRGNPEWLDQIRSYLDQTLPGFVQDDSGQGLIPLSVPSSNTLSIAGVVSVAGLAWSGLGWFGALQNGIRGVFGISGTPGNAVTGAVRNLVVMIVFGLGIVLSAGTSALAGSVAGRVAEAIGLGGQGWLLTLAGFLVGVAVDGALVVFLVRALVGVPVPWPALRVAALVGGIGLSALKLVGARLIAGTMSNPVYGSIGLVVGLLLWLNFIARILLFAAAWAAEDFAALTAQSPKATLATAATKPARSSATAATSPGTRTAPARPGAQVAGATASREPQPNLGQHTEDRVAIAAGAVLGATGAFALGSVLRAVRAIVRR